MGGKVHICAPTPARAETQLVNCPDCKKPSRHVLVLYEWYGWNRTCLRCGRNWQDSEWMPFAFYRYARRDNIRGAKAGYRRAKAILKEKGEDGERSYQA